MTTLRVTENLFYLNLRKGKEEVVGDRHMPWVSFRLRSGASQHFSFYKAMFFWRGSVLKGIPLGYCSFLHILFWKERAFCLGDREMKRISFREAVLVPNFCIVKAQN